MPEGWADLRGTEQHYKRRFRTVGNDEFEVTLSRAGTIEIRRTNFKSHGDALAFDFDTNPSQVRSAVNAFVEGIGGTWIP